MAGWGKVTKLRHDKNTEITGLHCKTFTAWVNASLKPCGMRIDSIATSLSGVALIKLLECLTKTQCPNRYNPNPNHISEKLDTLGVALGWAQSFIPFPLRVEPKDILDGDTKVILALVWKLILTFQNVLQQHNAGAQQEQATKKQSFAQKNREAKEKLLQWVRDQVGSYQHVNITKDFKESFGSGMAFCALVHRMRPNCIAYEQLDPSRSLDNLRLAIHLAEEQLGIPPLIAPEDVAQGDDKVIMTYLYEYARAFLAHGGPSQAAAAEEEARRRAAAEAEARRAAEQEAARRHAAEQEAARLQAAEQEAARLRAAEEEEARRRAAAAAADEEARRRQWEEEQARLAAQQEEERRRAEWEAYQQQQAQQAAAMSQPTTQIVEKTVVVHTGSNVGRVEVTVVEARYLKGDVLTGKADPYCIIQVERQSERTAKVKKTTAPRWNEKFSFYVSEAYATVDVTMFDSHRLVSDTFLGKVEVPISSLTPGVVHDAWHTLQPLHQGKPVSGELYLMILYHPAGV